MQPHHLWDTRFPKPKVQPWVGQANSLGSWFWDATETTQTSFTLQAAETKHWTLNQSPEGLITQELNSPGTRVAANHLITATSCGTCPWTVQWIRKYVELNIKWVTVPTERKQRRIWYLSVTPSFVWQELCYLDKSQTNQKQPVTSSRCEHQPDTSDG